MNPPETSFIEVQFKPAGSPKIFRVQIPTGIVSAFKNIDPGEEADIVESLSKCYQRLNEEWESAKFEPVSLGTSAEVVFNPPIPEPGPDFINALMKLERCGSDRKVKEAVLQLVKFTDYHTLNAPKIMPLIKRAASLAIQDNDQDFFKRLGRLLEKPGVPFTMPKERTPLASLLMEHWINQKKVAVQLCCFTDQAVVDFFRALGETFTLDAVRKARKRLGLCQARKLIKRVETKDGRITLG